MVPSQQRLIVFALIAVLLLTASVTEASLLDNLRSYISGHSQEPLVSGDDESTRNVNPKPKHEGKRVAVIGAGAAGASTAYYLHRFFGDSAISSVPLNITVFDKNPYIGGRSTTVDAYDDPNHPIELGASIFVAVNWNLVNASNEFGLHANVLTDASTRAKNENTDIVGIYDGKEVLFTYPEGDWWALAKLVYRYGPLAPWRTKKLTENTVGKFLTMYGAPVFPFRSLSEAVQDVGLLEATGVTGEQFLAANGITGGFAKELIQASTRVNYGQNLGLIHGLETMVCMAVEGAMAVEGGNWRIFDAMVRASAADVRLSTTVTSIAKTDSGEWRVASKSDAPDAEEISETYDSVVIAGPYQFTNIDVTPELQKTPDKIPYATLHVTLFASPMRPDPAYFGLKPGSLVPQAILTTLNDTEHADPGTQQGTGPRAVGNSGFFSLSTLKEVQRAGGVEYVYKVFSPEKFDDARVLAILGIKDAGVEGGITWMYRKIWQAYPYEYPRLTFEESTLTEDLWYTGGMDSFISTMETNSLMGKNIAKLMVDDWVKDAKPKANDLRGEKTGEEGHDAEL